MKKNIFLIIIDSVTCSSLFDNQYLAAPFFKKLSQESIYGQNMYSEAPYTEAALISLLGSVHTLDDNGYMLKFLNKKTVMQVFKDNDYKVFINHYYPSIFPSYMMPGVTEKYYVEGYTFTHLWEYRLKYYSELYDKNKLNSNDYKIMNTLIEDNFISWIDYLNKLKDNNEEVCLIRNNMDLQNLDTDILTVKEEQTKYLKDSHQYIDDLLEIKKEHALFKIHSYHCKNYISNLEFKNKIVNKYKKTFNKIQRKQFIYNLKNNHPNFKELRKAITSKDFTRAKGLLAGYKNSLFDKDIMDRITSNYDVFKAHPSFRTLLYHSLNWYAENEGKKFLYLHVDDAHFQESFFTYDTMDEHLLELEFNKINLFLDNLPKNYKGSITRDLSILYVDSLIEEFYESLKKNNQLSNTAFVISADHGFSYNFCPVRCKYVNSSYRENYNVPFLIYNNGQHEIKSNFYSTMDIAPTLLDLADIKIPKEFKGQSILKKDGRKYAYLEYMGGGCPDISRRKIQFGVRTEKYDVIMNISVNDIFSIDKIVEIYDIEVDPDQHNNLVAKKDILPITNEINLLEKRFLELQNQNRGNIDEN